MANFIYFDNAASSLPYKEVLDVYYKACLDYYANPSSVHHFGVDCNYLLDKTRTDILSLLKLDNNYEVIFTSGATEANNLAIKGIAFHYSNRGKHIITSKVEHPSILEVFADLKNNFGFDVTYLDVNEDGTVKLDELESNIRKDTILVSIMGVNNETGAINDLKKIKQICSKYPKIYFHSDLVQGIGKVNFDYKNLDLFTITGHKIHGLKGCGVLIKKKNIVLSALINGGGQENNFRSGTNDLPHALAFKKALEISFKNFKQSFERVQIIKNKLANYLNNDKENYHLNSCFLDENPYIVNFSTLKKKAAVVVEALSNENIFVSSISSCHSKKEKNSYVIEEMSHNPSLAHNTIRVSFSYLNTVEEVEILISTLERIIKSVKQ